MFFFLCFFSGSPGFFLNAYSYSGEKIDFVFSKTSIHVKENDQ